MLWTLPSLEHLFSVRRLAQSLFQHGCLPILERLLLLSSQGLERQYPQGIPQLDPAEDMGLEEPRALAAAAKLRGLQARLRGNAVHQVRPGVRPACNYSSKEKPLQLPATRGNMRG